MPDKGQGVEERTAGLLAGHAARRRIRELDVSGAALAGADLAGLHGDAISLAAADLSGATLHEAQLVACDLREANLDRANLDGATLRLCNLDGVRARTARFSHARIEDSSVQGADFSAADLRGARLTESAWARTSLRQALLNEVAGDGVTFRGADLREASLVGAQLVDADFRGADLSGADLSDGDFRGADFRGAILDGVRWGEAAYAGALFDADVLVVEPTHRAGVTGETGTPDAVAEALARFVSQAISTAARGGSISDRELERAVTEWEAWRGHVGEVDPAAMAELASSLDHALNDTGMLPPEVVRMFANLLYTIEEVERDAGDLEPPEEWKTLLRKLFPEIVQAEMEGTSLDELASKMAALFPVGGSRTRR